ncbi:DsbA family protein [Patescibacteria group bacterium]|nr:DsbA family protein [Candidatus Falkowbacteria bacterium]MBU3906226.1 DsbA family protein [Patescibacteria group bacterium]MBU4014935.1 DsbA family protein [Patescibacteria group bacterium]MBU4026855.1 DsbA family protein [Patescibacteria group bacterium]MBU4073419.1 DsbA family protein [Patescibacteria group bacterium]
MLKTNKSWHKKWWGILLIIFAIFILALIVASGFYVFDVVQKIKSGEPANRNILSRSVIGGKQYSAEGNGNYWIGSAKPKVTIVEFADFACSYCKNSFSKIREISVKHKDDVKIIFRDYPMHEESLALAMAARCAGEQGLFWLMHDKLFQNQGAAKDQLIELAKQIGADTVKFSQCLDSDKYAAQIQKDYDAGEELGVTGTPTWFINGYRVKGDIPYEVFAGVVEELIREY